MEEVENRINKDDTSHPNLLPSGEKGFVHRRQKCPNHLI
jgi:hypothetical protein